MRRFESQRGRVRAALALGLSAALCCATPHTASAESPPAATAEPAIPPAIQVWPSELPYERGQPIPAGYRLDSHENRALAITGATLFALFYFMSVASALADTGDQRAHDALLFPVAGPFVATAFVRNEDRPADQRGAYLTLGSFQTASVGLMVLSELFPTERLVLDHEPSASVHWGVGCIGSGQGVNISGSF